MIRNTAYQFSRGYKQGYLDLVGALESKADFDDRNALYAIYFPLEPLALPYYANYSASRDDIINARLYERKALLINSTLGSKKRC